MSSRSSGRASAASPGLAQPASAPDQEAEAVGLHGHPLHGSTARCVAAEAVGTFFLILAISATAIATALGRPVVGAPYGSMTIPLIAGMVLAAIVAGFGPVSGAHLNPAVTVALALHRRFPWRRVPAYASAQLAGAVAAALVAWAGYGSRARSAAALGATLPARGVGMWQVLGAETVGTAFLVLVIVGVASSAHGQVSAAAVPIGFALAATIFAAGPLSGAGVNPVRALGPMLVAGRFADWWCYVVGPFAGAFIAVEIHERLFRPASRPLS